MGGGGSKSTSKPVYTAQQKEVFKWMQGNVVPLAEGKETYMTQLMSQRARDEAARLESMQQQNLLQAAGATGMSAGQVAGALSNQQTSALQATLNQIMQNRMAMQQQALQMIGNIPISPGQQTEQKGEDPFKAAFGRATGGALGNLAGGVAGALVGAAIPGVGAAGGATMALGKPPTQSTSQS